MVASRAELLDKLFDLRMRRVEELNRYRVSPYVHKAGSSKDPVIIELNYQIERTEKELAQIQSNMATPDRPKSRGRKRDEEVSKRIGILHRCLIKSPADLQNEKKLLNAFAALEKAKRKIPGISGTDWIDLVRNPKRSEDLKTVKDALRSNLRRR